MDADGRDEVPDDLLQDILRAARQVARGNGGYGVLTIQFKGLDTAHHLIAPVIDIQMRQFRDKPQKKIS